MSFLSPSDVVVRWRPHQRLVVLRHLIVLWVVGRRRGVLWCGWRRPGNRFFVINFSKTKDHQIMEKRLSPECFLSLKINACLPPVHVSSLLRVLTLAGTLATAPTSSSGPLLVGIALLVLKITTTYR